MWYLREPDWNPFKPMAVFHFGTGAWARAANGRADAATDVTTELARTFNGKPIPDTTAAHLSIGPHVSDVRFK